MTQRCRVCGIVLDWNTSIGNLEWPEPNLCPNCAGKKIMNSEMIEVAPLGLNLPAWCDIAASAYRAYSASTGNKNFKGDPMPAWSELPEVIRTAWEAAVRQVGSIIQSNGSYGLDIEQRWAGWKPSHVE